MFENESLKILIALATVVGVFIVLYWRRSAPTEILFSLALGLYVACGIIEPADAWRGFGNSTVIAIGSLLVVTAGLRTSGVLDQIGRTLLGKANTEFGALMRLTGAVTLSSAFLLNTAIVSMLLPVVVNWCRSRNISPSRLLMPISYLAILGGTCTLVGTSTNFVVNESLNSLTKQLDASISNNALGTIAADSELASYDPAWLLKHRDQFKPMILYDISWVGVPCALVGAAFLILFGRRILPNRTEMLDRLEEKRREYLVELMVTSGCDLIGKTVEEGGLRHLPGLFLIEIDRGNEVIAPVAPSDRIYENDRLVFTGVVSTIVDLEKIPGLVPPTDLEESKPTDADNRRSMVEVVLSPSSPLVGSSIRNANFRRLYGAAVIAVHRNGERLPTKIGDIELASGDTLLLQTEPGFVRNFRNRPDFYLVSGVGETGTRRHNKAWTAGGIVIGLILWLLLMPALPWALGSLYAGEIPDFFTSPAAAIFVAAMAMIITRCLSTADARNAIDFPMLLTIGSAIGVGTGVYQSGAADFLARFIGDGISHPHLALIAVFFFTVCLTEMISNVAVAAVMVPIAIGLASTLGINPRPFIMAVTLGASLSFVSPIGYQTNLMVMGPGGYRPSDYLRAGLPLTIIVGIVAILLIPLKWPF